MIMNGLQIIKAVEIVPEMENLFKGVYINKNLPYNLIGKKDYFFIVNTLNKVSQSMGHWILFFIRDFELLFFDSFAMTPEYYDWEIYDFFEAYPYKKKIVFNKPLQRDSSYTCGAYSITFAYYMTKGKTLYYIKSLFSNNKTKNDSYVVSFLYSLVGFQQNCSIELCPNVNFNNKCNMFCIC